MPWTTYERASACVVVPSPRVPDDLDGVRGVASILSMARAAARPGCGEEHPVAGPVRWSSRVPRVTVAPYAPAVKARILAVFVSRETSIGGREAVRRTLVTLSLGGPGDDRHSTPSACHYRRPLPRPCGHAVPPLSSLRAARAFCSSKEEPGARYARVTFRMTSLCECFTWNIAIDPVRRVVTQTVLTPADHASRGPGVSR